VTLYGAIFFSGCGVKDLKFKNILAAGTDEPGHVTETAFRFLLITVFNSIHIPTKSWYRNEI
jgi:hypothetical protein